MIVTMLRNAGSQGARVLAESLSEALGRKVGLATAGSERRCADDRYVINWGVSQEPRFFRQRQLTFSNSCESVANCQNKIRTLDVLVHDEVPCIEHTVDEHRTEEWLNADGKIIARQTVTGHSGAGIQIVRRGQPIPDAALYTRYFRKHAEYRVHVAFGTVILIQQKRKRNGVEQNDEQALIRTHANGWVFATNDCSCDARNYRDALGALALRAANAVGAAHCAVDILTNHDTMQHVVCEINSAPGIEAGSTKEAYTNAFVNKLRNL